MLNKAYDSGCKTSDHAEGVSKIDPSSVKTSSGLNLPTEDILPKAREPEVTNLPTSGPVPSKRGVKETPFFDPKRIFAKPEGNAQNKQKDYVPNNQQAKRQSPDPLLNNGKPKSNLTSSINRSCYINNDLRDPRKQTNAKSAQTQTTPSHQRKEGAHSQARPEQADPPSQSVPHQATNIQAKPSANQKRRTNIGPEKKKKDEAPPPKPKRGKREGETGGDTTHLLGKGLHI